MPAYLFLAALGPVQDFIAGARRTRDLWFGSWLLSTLSAHAAEAIQQQGGRLIFPPPDLVQSKETRFANVANKILARVTLDPATVGKAMETAVRQRLREIWQQARTQFSGNFTDDVHAQQQIDDLIEIYWVAVEITPENDYPRQQVERLMAARKATRDFRPVTWGSQVPKSSIDGQRESVIPEDRYPNPRMSKEERKVVVDALYRDYKAGAAEHLSAVDLLKRHGKCRDKHSFPSTADVAVRPLLDQLKPNPAVAIGAWQTYFDVLKSLAGERMDEERVDRNNPILGHYDAGLLLESRLRELFDDVSQYETAQHALRRFYQTIDYAPPEPYYAILMADGDRMGATLDHQDQQDDHIEISRRLGQFAKQAHTLVERHQGSLIYAGGDDVLAFLPLHTALACAKDLHQSFGDIINPVGKQRFVDEDDCSPTLSVGLAIVHYIEPLSDALDLARKAEKAAKRVQGKDALAILLSKRSGADILVAGKWSMFDQDLTTLVAMHHHDWVPDGAAYELRDLVERLTPQQGAPTIQAAAVLAEARRILRRKQPKRGNEANLASETFAQLDAMLQRGEPTLEASTALALVRMLAEMLIVTRILAVVTPVTNAVEEHA